MKLFLIGFMGSGKTHWGKLLAEKMNLPFFDLDAVIEQKEKATIADIFAEKGEEFFRYAEKEVLEKLVAANKDFIISCGGGTPCFFNNIGFMKQKGLVIWLNTQIDTLVGRLLKQKNSRPLLKDIADREIKQYIVSKILRRRLYYEQADIMVHEETLSVDTFAEIIANA
ncbi:MAG: shikimate kinase [Williamsia sp.]|nr:shikimate kinase [Williamsia sp.]